MRDEWGCPIFVAGDVFHSYDEGAELTNFLIDRMPCVYAVPGQHDLRHHRYEDMDKGSFWTLVKANRIIPIAPGETKVFDTFSVTGFPWGSPIISPQKSHSLLLQIALVHAYVWTPARKFPGAPESAFWLERAKQLKDYHVGFFGDNHLPFTAVDGDVTICNCGAWMRQKADEVGEVPSVWLLMQDGSIVRRPLESVGDDVYLEGEKTIKTGGSLDLDLSGYFDDAEADEVDFEQTLKRVMDQEGTKDSVRELVLGSVKK